jgi:hypothetical protein
VWLEEVDLHGQLAAHEVEEGLEDLLPLVGGEGRERRAGALPGGLVGDEVGEGLVADVEETALLEVREGDAPASLQVAVDAVAEDVAEGALGVGLREKPHVRVAGVGRERQAERLEDPLGQLVVLDSRGAGVDDGPVEPGAEDTDLDEVVEVARLEGRVLPVVGEAEELLRLLGEGLLRADLPDGREAEDGRGRAAPFGAERPDLSEVGHLARPVGHAALEAEAEWRGHEVAGLPLGAFRSVGVDEDGPRKGLPLVGLDAPAARPLLDPVFREAVEDGAVVRRPRVVGAEEEEAGLGVPVLRAIRRLARLVGARRRLVAAADAVVLLPALAAEDEGQEDATPVSRHEPLTVDGDVPLVFRLDGGVDGVAPADELVDAEGEGRVARLGVAGEVAGEEPRAGRVGAEVLVEPGQGREVARGALVAEDAPGRADPHEAAGALFFRRAEGRLEPGREGMRKERVVVGRKAVARRLDRRAELSEPGRVVGRARLRGSP